MTKEICIKCKKEKSVHRATDTACPIGRAHRSIGYTAYNALNVFTPKPPKQPKADKSGSTIGR
jgi:hypothetical protein